jgi:hypothetical protein
VLCVVCVMCVNLSVVCYCLWQAGSCHTHKYVPVTTAWRVTLRNIARSLGTRLILRYDLSNGKGHEIWHVECEESVYKVVQI